MSPYGTLNCETLGNDEIAAGTVCAADVEVGEIANTKSFQQMMNTMMNVVTIPGVASGTITLRNAWNGCRPVDLRRLLELSRYLSEEGRKHEIDSGSANVMYGMINPGQVSYSPIWRHKL